jgi:ATP-dependent DNA helicase RecQ
MLSELQKVIEKHWGFRSLRPLQEKAMRAVLEGRDSLVVLPTGGGKSLCYQAPAAFRQETTVVVSPLIALMKDQVDNLQACGVPAIQLDSSQTSQERYHYEQDILQGAVRLLFVAPERLVNTSFYQLLRRIKVRTFAIDEAHCISHWGHDFRPEYRQLGRIKELFPQASVHAYTATATERVRQDIVAQLGLKNPEVLVGNFDRPNLNYRVLPRHDSTRQILQVLQRHAGEAGLIYCLTRRDVDELAALLRQQGYKAMAYHAGLTPEARKEAQNAFATEQCDLVVATVAFGMGIDRSNIRFVLHTAMPKSVEHYQQETGRAGRDGLEAECVLLHSGADVLRWKAILEKNAAEPGVDANFLANSLHHLDDMDRYCRGAVCRHRALVQYFGQTYPANSCGACDLCLGDNEEVPDAQVVAQKILSCVARVRERFGITHVLSVLRGEKTERVQKFGHDRLPTFGLLQDRTKADIRDWIYQLISHKVLVQNEIALPSGDKVPILGLNEASWEVMKGQRTVRLVQLVRRKIAEKSRAETVSWEGVDRTLFDALRQLRRRLAEERQKPPYIIFTDATLRQLACVRPSTSEWMRLVSGVGDVKMRDFGNLFLEVIGQHCQQRKLSRDNFGGVGRPEESRKPPARSTPWRTLAFEQFRKGSTIEDVMHQTGRPRSTIVDYLAEFIRQDRPPSITPWVREEVYQRVAGAVRQVGTTQLRPIFLLLGEKVPYDEIRLVVAHLTGRGER